ncbi:MAG: acetate kinase [Actinomycetota bacterium]|nr:acetate kinase [Actinomycetota bacterium]
MTLLVVNAGSSSLKLSLLDASEKVIAHDDISDWRGDDAPIGDFVTRAGAIDTVGHRVVHGGTAFTEPVAIDDAVIDGLRDLTSLAPLHQPRAIAAIEAARGALPGATHVACFDTAFHATIPPAANTYALPATWRARWPLRRFGFHGLSHAYAARRAAELAGRELTELHIVTCHLGAGASLCAIERGCSVDTTMGFTPLEGLVMATRAGSIDPGLVLWLLQEAGLRASEVGEKLEQQSGLVGLAGTADMREVIERKTGGDAAAALAFDVYAHRLRREIGAMSAALETVDVCVFTGGVGEHAPLVRAATRFPLDRAANESTTGDGEISAAGSRMRTFVVTAREDLEIAREVRALLA